MRKLVLFTLAYFGSLLAATGQPAGGLFIIIAITLLIMATRRRQTWWGRSAWIAVGAASGALVGWADADARAPVARGVLERGVEVRGTVMGLVTGTEERARARLGDTEGLEWALTWRKDSGGRASEHPLVRAGDAILGTGLRERLSAPSNPFEFDMQAFQAGRGLEGTITLRNWVCRPTASPAGAEWVWAWIGGVRESARASIRSLDIPLGYQAIVAALVLGDSAGLGKESRALYSATGTAHLFAVSGLHLSTVGQFFWLVLGALGCLVPDSKGLGGTRRWGSLLVLCGGTFYLLLTGAPVSCLRAYIMLCGQVVAVWLQRDYDAWTWLSASALLLACARPAAMRETSFQLSVACVASMLLSAELAREWRRRSGNGGLQLGVFGPLWESAKTSWASSLMTLPMVWSQFGGIPLLPVPANMVAVPLISIVVFPLCLAAAFVPLPECVSPLLGWLLAFLMDILEAWLRGIVSISGSLRWAWPGWVLAGTTSGLLFAATFWGSWRWRTGVAALAATLVVCAMPPRSPLGEGQWKWTFFDVDEADMALLETAEGATALIDAGRRGAGNRILLPYLWRQGIDRIDVVVISHAHDDHYGGMAEVASQVKVCEYWVAAGTGAAAIVSSLSRAGEGCGGPPRVREWRAGQAVEWVGARWVAWWPGGCSTGCGANDSSLVLTATWPEAQFLLPGDVEGTHAKSGVLQLAQRLADHVGQFPDRHVPLVAKAPHHAHRSPMLSYLTQMIRPNVAFLPSGGELVEWRSFWRNGIWSPPALLWLSGERGAMEISGGLGEFSVKVSEE